MAPFLSNSYRQKGAGFGFWIAGFLFVAAFVGVNGYQFGLGNQVEYLPIIKAMATGEAFNHDSNLEAFRYYHHNFLRMASFFCQFIDVARLFFWGYCLTAFLHFAGIFVLTRDLFARSVMALSAPFIMLLWGSRGLDGHTLWNNSCFEAQFLAWPLLLFGLHFFLTKKIFLSGIFFGLTFLLHSQIGLVIFGAVGITMLLMFPRCQKARAGLIFFTGFMLIAAPVFWQQRSIFLTGGAFIPGFSVDYAAFRMPHHFEFRPYDTGLFFTLFCIGHLAFWTWAKGPMVDKAVKNRHLSLLVLNSVIFLFFFLHYGDYYILRWGLVAKLQMLRMGPLVHLCVCLYAIFLSFYLARQPKRKYQMFAILLFFGLGPFLFSESFSEVIARWMGDNPPQRVGRRKAAHVFNLSDISSPWVVFCRSIPAKTQKDAVFITPPYQAGFTFYAERSMVAEFKVNPLIEKQTLPWLQKLGDLSDTRDIMIKCNGFKTCLPLLRKGYLKLTPEKVISLGAKYRAVYFLTEAGYNYPFSIVKKNDFFCLYDLRKRP